MKTIRLSALVCILGLAGTASLQGCSSDDQHEQAEAGTLEFALTGVSNTGSLYRLRDGNFTVTGPATTSFSTETDPDAPSIAVQLPAGDYNIELAEGWLLEKEVDGEFVETESTLESPNPVSFTIASSALTGVVFQFRSEGEIIELGDGTLEVDIAVDDLECALPTMVCNGACVDITADPNNCGACGQVCDVEGASAICLNGVCQVGTCDAGLADCDTNGGNGCETSTGSDVQNCGACNQVCPANGGIPSCDAGSCDIMCHPGFGDCNSAPGCETPTVTDLNNCGACGNHCVPRPNSQPMCQAAMCQLQSCNVGFANCDNQAISGCEVLLNSNPSCGQAQTLGTVSGDSGSANLQATGLGEARYRVEVTENDVSLSGTNNDLAVRFTLNWSGDTQYSLEAGCDGCTPATSNGSNPATVTLRWPDNAGLFSDPSPTRSVFVNVIANGTPSISPSACNQWTLSASGNPNGGQNTCSGSF